MISAPPDELAEKVFGSPFRFGTPQQCARAVPDRPSYGAIAAATLLSRMAGIGSLMPNTLRAPLTNLTKD
jgi:hypothetical protein